MNQQKLTIRFVLLRAKINKRGMCPLSCRLTLNGKRKAFATGQFVNPENWNSKLQETTATTLTSQQINQQLNIIKTDIRNIYLRLQLDKNAFTVNEIFDSYKGVPLLQENTILEYFKEYLNKMRSLIGIDIKESTWMKFFYMNEQLKEFIKWKYEKSDFELSKLKLQFINDFEYYLKTVKKQKQITINKTLQRFRKPIRVAVNEGLLDIDPFLPFKAKSVLKEVVFLTVDELNRIEKHVFNQERLKEVKDLFVFCCYTGLAYREMNNLQPKHIIKGFDGNEWIQIKREKTGKMLSVPILPKAKAILVKYAEIEGKPLPSYSNQKINSYLKEIAEIIGIEKRITHHTARKTFASTVLLYNDIPIELVSELLGHSSIQITQQYYGKVVQKKISREMNLLKSRLEN